MVRWIWKSPLCIFSGRPVVWRFPHQVFNNGTNFVLRSWPHGYGQNMINSLEWLLTVSKKFRWFMINNRGHGGNQGWSTINSRFARPSHAVKQPHLQGSLHLPTNIGPSQRTKAATPNSGGIQHWSSGNPKASFQVKRFPQTNLKLNPSHRLKVLTPLKGFLLACTCGSQDVLPGW